MSPAPATRPMFDDPDGFYEALVSAHEGLSDDESRALDARLVLLLAHEVGRLQRLKELLAQARAACAPAGEGPHP